MLDAATQLTWGKSYSFFDGAEFFELGTKSAIIGVPCKATMSESASEAPVSMNNDGRTQ